MEGRVWWPVVPGCGLYTGATRPFRIFSLISRVLRQTRTLFHARRDAMRRRVLGRFLFCACLFFFLNISAFLIVGLMSWYPCTLSAYSKLGYNFDTAPRRAAIVSLGVDALVSLMPSAKRSFKGCVFVPNLNLWINLSSEIGHLSLNS